MKNSSPLPLIGVTACVKPIDDTPFHSVGDKYVRAVAVSAGGAPMVIPSLEALIEVAGLVTCLDGLMLTGSPSNVHPSLYGQAPTPEAEPHDPERDGTALPLIHAALEHGVPLLAICRGFQELNVALGGSLHARVHEMPGRMDHRRPQHPDLDVQYGPKHEVTFRADSPFARLAGSREARVNSLHNQGLDRVAEGLEIEGEAPDGTVEAVSVKNAKAFALGVQWHPEYKSWENAFSARLFAAFGDAARQRARDRAEGRLQRPAVAAVV